MVYPWSFDKNREMRYGLLRESWCGSYEGGGVSKMSFWVFGIGLKD